MRVTRDWQATVAGVLDPRAARLAAIHPPHRLRGDDFCGGGTEPHCHGCDPGSPADDPPEWPCRTATVALDMMGLQAEEFVS